MKIVVTIDDSSEIRTGGWSVADAIDHARRNPEEWTLVASGEVLFIEAIEPLDTASCPNRQGET